MIASAKSFHVSLALGLRAATLGGRFGLTIALAAIAPAEVVGAFGLYSSALILSYSIMGMDVYAATTRELLAGVDTGEPLRRHFGFILLAYLFFLPLVMFAALHAGAIQWGIVLLFAAHIAFEYYCQEFGRLMVVVGMPLASTFVLFVRSTLWIPPALLLIWSFPMVDPVLILVACWLGGSVFSAWIIVLLLRRIGRETIIPVFDRVWLRRAVKASFLFFIGTLVFRALMNGDKFVVNHFLSLDLLGVYTVYASEAMGLLALAETGISAWLYPAMVAAIQGKDWPQVRALLAGFRNRMIIGATVGGAALAVVIPVLLNWIGEADYTKELGSFYCILFGASLYCMSMPYHYVIYGLGRDSVFLVIYLSAFVVMLAVGILMLPESGLLGAGMMLGLALAFIGAARYVAARILLAKIDVATLPGVSL